MGRFPTCSICIEVFANFGDVSACPCGHTFHRDCLTSWVSRCESRGQLPACPTCSKPFESRPAKGVIESLYFSFDADGQHPEFSDEFLAKQMDLNEKLSGDLANRDAEIRCLRAKLARSEADHKEFKATRDGGKNLREDEQGGAEEGRVAEIKSLREQLSCSEASLITIQETLEKEKAEQARLKIDFATKEAAHASEMASLREKLTFSQTDVSCYKERCLTLRDELKDLRKQHDCLSQWKHDCSRHVVISNLHDKVHPNSLRGRLAKWGPETVVMEIDQRDFKTAFVSLRNSEEAHEVIEKLHDVAWYDMKMKVRHAMGDEAQELNLRELVVSNIPSTACSKDFERLLWYNGYLRRYTGIEFDETLATHCNPGTPGLKKHVVTFSTSCDAKAFYRQFNGHIFHGEPLQVNLHSRAELKANKQGDPYSVNPRY